MQLTNTTSAIARRLARRHAALFLPLALACRGAPSAEHRDPTARIEIPPARAHPLVGASIDVEHYALDVDLDPAARAMHATCTLRFVSRVEALKQVDLELAGLDVSAVRSENGAALGFARSGSALHIALDRPLARGEPSEIAIAYGGKPEKGLWFAAERDGVPTEVFTQGECEDAHWWFPCSDRPDDRATSEIRVSMPSTWIAVAAGERIERIENGGRAIERWRMTTPHPAYLTTLVAGELATTTDAWDGVPLLYVTRPRDVERAAASFKDTADVLAYFSTVTGWRYPYPKYSQACVDNFPFGGMENISATTLTETTLQDERGNRDAPSTPLVAHEAAHQWFGDLLTCREWSHAWLNEGFATYFGALYLEHSRGIDEFRVAMRDIQESYVALDVGQNRRPTVYDVYRDPLDLFFGGHTYQGGAARLHWLRFVLGDAAFFRGLRLYVGRNAGRSVVTDDLRRALEEASRADLRAYFEQWFEKPGFPEFQVSWKYDQSRKQALLTVNQVQNVDDGTPAAFRSPVDVEIRDSHGVRVQRFEVELRRHLFELPAPEEPIWVRFDAHGAIPKRLDDKKSAREWLAIAAECDDVNARRDALTVLGRDWDQTNGEQERQRIASTMLARLASDPCAAVRVAAAKALASVHRPEAREALAAAAANDPEARVRVAALEALQAHVADADLAALALREYRAGYSWSTMAAAAALYRRAHVDGAFEWLQAELATTSPHAQLEAKLIAEISELRTGKDADAPRDARVTPLLLSIARDEGRDEAARGAAVKALGRIGPGNADVRSELARLLETRSWRLRREVIAALVVLKDPAALPALSAYYARTVFPTERRAIEAAFSAPSPGG